MNGEPEPKSRAVGKSPGNSEKSDGKSGKSGKSVDKSVKASLLANLENLAGSHEDEVSTLLAKVGSQLQSVQQSLDKMENEPLRFTVFHTNFSKLCQI